MHPRDYRISQKISVPDIAAKVGVTPRAIYHYENGTREPSLKIIRAYREMSNGLVTADDFYCAGSAHGATQIEAQPPP